jgi:hypothetical protein
MWQKIIPDEAYNNEVIVTNGQFSFTPTMCYRGDELIKAGYLWCLYTSELLKLLPKQQAYE